MKMIICTLHIRTLVLFLLVIIQERSVAFKNFDYCKAKCFGNKHAACQDDSSPKPCLNKCRSDYQYGSYIYPTDEQRESILHIHNTLRNKVAGGFETQGNLKGRKFSDVHIISWNYESEFIASCTAQNCILKHDKCRTLENATYCGQNGGERTGATATPTYFERSDAFDTTAKNWYKEVQKCADCDYSTYPPKSLDAGNDISHFTQFIWAKSTHIGCAYFCFKNDKKKDKVILWCNYCPAGNYRKKPIMVEGDLGPDCGQDKRYPYLCGKQVPLVGAIIFSHKQSVVLLIISVIFIKYFFKFKL